MSWLGSGLSLMCHLARGTPIGQAMAHAKRVLTLACASTRLSVSSLLSRSMVGKSSQSRRDDGPPRLHSAGLHLVGGARAQKIILLTYLSLKHVKQRAPIRF